MNYLYKINPLYDGFTPQKIEERMANGFLEYNWKEYFDEINKGDIIYTFFIGRNIKKGIYAIAKVYEKYQDKKVKAKVLYHDNTPLIEPSEFRRYESEIITRPFGSVYVIPPSLDVTFERIKKDIIISEIEIGENVRCEDCVKTKLFCHNCPLFKKKFLIKWDNEVDLNIPYAEKIIAPFWILPRQSHWIKINLTDHPPSKIMYSFKSGYKTYALPLALGIVKAIQTSTHFKNIRFDFILGVPLSPTKKQNKEIDRVAEICKILEKELNVPYLENTLQLLNHISRKEWKWLGRQGSFVKDYYNALKIDTTLNLDDKSILLVDDIITDGATLKSTCKKIKDTFNNCKIYIATGCITAKKNNMKYDVIQKFSR